MKNKLYYRDIDFIRLLSCIAVLLYHLDLLKGGYLAVCTFFVLTGFLSSATALKKEKFSILNYYKNRIINIYLPLLIVVFISIFLVTILTSFNWINLKPETTSVIFGYNNYWQLSANQDYFTRFITSPFTHFWYMGILLQFELIFPFVFIILKKIGDKIHKLIPCLLLSILSIISVTYFYLNSSLTSIMNVYYDSLSRIFSILFGVTIGFIYHYYNNYVPKIFNNKIINRLIFYTYVLLLIVLLISIPSASKYFSIAMIITTLITCRLIKYGIMINSNKQNKIIKSLANISYEVYLIQYPVLFLIQNLEIKNQILSNTIIILLTVICSAILHFAINYKKNENSKIRFKKTKYLVLSMLIIISSFGVYKYINSKDYTQDAEDLKNKLEENERLMLEKQKEYELHLKEETDNWQKVLDDLNAGEENIKNVVSNLHVIGIGDSVILDAIPYLYKLFPNGYFDAKQSRTDYEADDIVIDLKRKNMLGEPIVFGLGTNGQCGLRCQREIVSLCENRKIFWINVTNDREVHVNSTIERLANEYENVYLIDWNKIAEGHNEYFIYDGVHLKRAGQIAYANAIYDSIYKVYLDEFLAKKNEIIEKHNLEKKDKLSFYGNELLLNVMEYMQDEYKGIEFNIDKNYTFKDLYNEIKNKKDQDLLTNNITFVFDNNFNINENEFKELMELCKDNKVTFISLNENKIKTEYENLKYINIFDEIFNNDEYILFDKKHLSEKANIYISNIIKNTNEKQGD